MKYSLIGPVYPYRGGIAHYTTCLAHTLTECGHQIQVVSFRRQYPRWLYPGKSDRDPSQQPLKVMAQYDLDPIEPWTWLRTTKAIQRFQPDATVISWWTTFWAPAFWAISSILSREQIRVIFLIHNVFPHEKRKWDIWLARAVLRNGDAYIVQSPGEQKRLLALFPDALVLFHPHPVYSFLSEQHYSKSEAKQYFDIPPERYVILFFGIVRKYKGLKYLIDATAELISRGVNVHLLIAGEFWEDENQYIRQIDQLRIADRVTIDNRYIPNEEMTWYFSAADLFVAPYISGTQSGVVTLALDFGLPVVLTETIAQGLPEGNFNLRIVPSENVAALAQGIEEIIINLPPEYRPKPMIDKESWFKLAGVIAALTHPK